ncbi:hypothetical protein N657DRAFT_538941, partial [Parathielavia appendiculata]
IHCKLVSTTFSERPQYEALSYGWGVEPQPAFRFRTVNGTHVKVDRDLWNALSHLRSRTQSQVLWVDALCFNHYDTNEMHGQIPLMLFIYSRTRGVLVWL